MTDENQTSPAIDESSEAQAAEALGLDEEALRSVLESLIFTASEPVPARRLARLVGMTTDAIAPALEQLEAQYAQRGITLQQVAGGYQFRSAAGNAAWVQKLVAPKPLRLTRAQLETIAIIAYRQPVTRPEIEDVRGVDCGSAMEMLGERGLIKILGRKDEPGRPLLYGTTPEFLAFFGLNSLRDLPTLREFSELSEQHRTLFAQELGEMELERANEEARTVQSAAVHELEALETPPIAPSESESFAAGEEPQRSVEIVEEMVVVRSAAS